MPERDKPDKEASARKPAKREKLPPKGTAARLALASGLWSHMTDEEIEHIRGEIYGSRRSSR